ncbi:MAG: Mur ligase family protein, partial [Bryobacteraceae bacterium]
MILTVRWQHSLNFDSLDLIAAQKAKLLDGLNREGLAILNAGDARVAATAKPGLFRVARFGASPDCDVWATDISAKWPQRLQLQVHTAAESARVETRLVGRH